MLPLKPLLFFGDKPLFFCQQLLFQTRNPYTPLNNLSIQLYDSVLQNFQLSLVAFFLWFYHLTHDLVVILLVLILLVV